MNEIIMQQRIRRRKGRKGTCPLLKSLTKKDNHPGGRVDFTFLVPPLYRVSEPVTEEYTDSDLI